jgi:hypothetical protein
LVEFADQHAELLLQGFQQTKVGLARAAIVGFVLGPPDQLFLGLEFAKDERLDLFIESTTFPTDNRHLMPVPSHELRVLADDAFYTADDRPGSVVNDRDFHLRNDPADPVIRQICLAIGNQESGLNPERCVLIWLSFGPREMPG